MATAIWAYRDYNQREGQVDPTHLFADGPAERARLGEEERALGLAMTAYQEMLESDPENAQAQLGLFRASMRTSGVAPQRSDASEVLRGVIGNYLERRERIDPDETVLQQCLHEWIELRMHHDWYLARASVAMWLATRGNKEAFEEIKDLNRQGPFFRDHFAYAQRYMPNWTGIAPLVEQYLQADDIVARIYAGVTLLQYNRIYGVGQDLLDRHRSTLRASFIEAKANLRPDMGDNTPSTPGGQTLLGLALLGTKDTRRILERMSPMEHPYLAAVLANARLWAGLDPIEKVDFEKPKYRSWSPVDQEFYFRGAMMRFIDLVRRERAESDPAKKAKLAEQLNVMRDIADRARFFGMTVVRLNAARVYAAAYPEDSSKIHRELLAAGGAESIFGAMVLPRAERIPHLLPVLSALTPDYSSLAAAAMLTPDAVSPIQMPVTRPPR